MDIVRRGCQPIRLKDSLINNIFWVIHSIILIFLYADKYPRKEGIKTPPSEGSWSVRLSANHITESFDQQYLLSFY